MRTATTTAAFTTTAPPPAALPALLAEEEVWKCHKCQKDNLNAKARCGSCQAWRGGKRESYSKKRKNNPLITTEASNLLAILESSWTCPCGSINKAKKVRCTKCQKWRGGRRMHKGALTAKWHAERLLRLQQQQQQQQQQSSSSTTGALPNNNNATTTIMNQLLKEEDATQKEPWTCDKCSHTNAGTKVRCTNCPRWRNGKRPKYGKKAVMQQHQQQLMQHHQQLQQRGMQHPYPPPTTMNNNGSGPPPPTAMVAGLDMQQQATLAQGGWFCRGCNHLNTVKKARCGSCQRWKLGKRENMLKKNRAITHPAPPDLPPLMPGMSDDQFTAFAAEQWWSCECGQTNLALKTRCSSCQRWKGGKRENIRRKAQVDNNNSVTPTATTTAAARPAATVVTNNTARMSSSSTSKVMMMPHQPNQPWKCFCCGNHNGCKKLRCGTCQSWKNGKKQLRQRAVTTGSVPPPTTTPGGNPTTQNNNNVQYLTNTNADGELYAPPFWECHGCNAQVIGTKTRCPSCKSWKGGVRLNLHGSKNNNNKNGKNKKENGNSNNMKNPAATPWICHGCKRENLGRRVRCADCQSWRGGGRPDVAARKAAEERLKGNWMCDREGCQRLNKATKVRCGGCQRWRGGQRPDIRKNARTNNQYHLAVTQPRYNHHQLPQFVVQQPHISHQLVHPTMRHHPTMPMGGGAPPPPVAAGVAHHTPMNNATATATAVNNNNNATHHVVHNNQNFMEASQQPPPTPQQQQTTVPPPPLQGGQGTIPMAQQQQQQRQAAQEVGVENNEVKTTTNIGGAWTCSKCTCDNHLHEMKCKICDNPRDDWV
mmetsp:Transcript_26252/g.55408  ORF Transcript_26252/g.55408 Transcript_26252/m.55408 type:complete len:820 (+) Transcript_26252:1081-3540(+)